jgi:hypothetical protein
LLRDDWFWHKLLLEIHLKLILAQVASEDAFITVFGTNCFWGCIYDWFWHKLLLEILLKIISAKVFRTRFFLSFCLFVFDVVMWTSIWTNNLIGYIFRFLQQTLFWTNNLRLRCSDF